MRVESRWAGILFDLDDTLLDHRGAAREALRTWGHEHGLEGVLDDWEARWWELEAIYYGRFQAREITIEEQRRARVREFFPDHDLTDDATADAMFGNYWERYESSWRAFPDALPAIRRARASGAAVGIFTNGEASGQRRKAVAAGLDLVEISFIASSELAAAKPSAIAYAEACAMLRVRPDRCLMIGDSVVNDVAGALAAGLGAVLLDRQDQHVRAPAARVTNLDALDFRA